MAGDPYFAVGVPYGIVPSEQFRHRLSRRHPHRPPGLIADLRMRVDAEAAEDCRADVRRREDAALGRVRADGVGSAMDVAQPDTATRHHGGIAAFPVVASGT